MFLRNIAMFVAGFTVVACGSMQTSATSTTRTTNVPMGHIDARLMPLVNRFLDSCREAGRTCQTNGLEARVLDTVKTEESPDRVGVCYLGFDENNTFRRLIHVTELATEVQFQALVVHELAHCSMNVGHVDTEPHLMNSYLLDTRTLTENWEALYRAVFTTVYAERLGLTAGDEVE